MGNNFLKTVLESWKMSCARSVEKFSFFKGANDVHDTIFQRYISSYQRSQMCQANIFFILPTKIPPQIYLIAPFSSTTFDTKAYFYEKIAQIKEQDIIWSN